MIKPNQPSPSFLSSVSLQGIGSDKSRAMFDMGGGCFSVNGLHILATPVLLSHFASFITRTLGETCPGLMLNCRVMGFTLRQAQICPGFPSLSEWALSSVACDVCRHRGFGFNFKVFYSMFLLHFVPLALRLHAVRTSTFPRMALALEMEKKEWRVVSVGPLS